MAVDLSMLTRMISCILIVAGAMTFVMACNALQYGEGYLYTARRNLTLAFLICGFVLICLSAKAPTIQLGPSEELQTQRKEYVVYLDGNEVDNDKINLDLYSVTYDDENHVAYATTRQNTHTHMVPMVIPIF